MKLNDYIRIILVLFIGTFVSSAQILINPFALASGGGAGGPGLRATDDFDSYAHLTDLVGTANWDSCLDYPNTWKSGADGRIGGSTFSMVRYTGVSFTSNQRCELTLDGTLSSFEFITAGVRCFAGDTRYWFQSDGSTWYLVVRMAGVQSVISTGTHPTITVGDKIALDATGTGSATRLTAQIYYSGSWHNVTGAVSVDPGSGKYIDGGSPGAGSSSTTALGDDFAGYNL